MVSNASQIWKEKALEFSQAAMALEIAWGDLTHNDENELHCYPHHSNHSERDWTLIWPGCPKCTEVEKAYSYTIGMSFDEFVDGLNGWVEALGIIGRGV